SGVLPSAVRAPCVRSGEGASDEIGLVATVGRSPFALCEAPRSARAFREAVIRDGTGDAVTRRLTSLRMARAARRIGSGRTVSALGADICRNRRRAVLVVLELPTSDLRSVVTLLRTRARLPKVQVYRAVTRLSRGLHTSPITSAHVASIRVHS